MITRKAGRGAREKRERVGGERERLCKGVYYIRIYIYIFIRKYIRIRAEEEHRVVDSVPIQHKVQ